MFSTDLRPTAARDDSCPFVSSLPTPTPDDIPLRPFAPPLPTMTVNECPLRPFIPRLALAGWLLLCENEYRLQVNSSTAVARHFHVRATIRLGPIPLVAEGTAAPRVSPALATAVSRYGLIRQPFRSLMTARSLLERTHVVLWTIEPHAPCSSNGARSSSVLRMPFVSWKKSMKEKSIIHTTGGNFTHRQRSNEGSYRRHEYKTWGEEQ